MRRKNNLYYLAIKHSQLTQNKSQARPHQGTYSEQSQGNASSSSNIFRTRDGKNSTEYIFYNSALTDMANRSNAKNCRDNDNQFKKNHIKNNQMKRLGIYMGHIKKVREISKEELNEKYKKLKKLAYSSKQFRRINNNDIQFRQSMETKQLYQCNISKISQNYQNYKKIWRKTERKIPQQTSKIFTKFNNKYSTWYFDDQANKQGYTYRKKRELLSNLQIQRKRLNILPTDWKNNLRTECQLSNMFDGAYVESVSNSAIKIHGKNKLQKQKDWIDGNQYSSFMPVQNEQADQLCQKVEKEQPKAKQMASNKKLNKLPIEKPKIISRSLWI